MERYIRDRDRKRVKFTRREKMLLLFITHAFLHKNIRFCAEIASKMMNISPSRGMSDVREEYSKSAVSGLAPLPLRLYWPCFNWTHFKVYASKYKLFAYTFTIPQFYAHFEAYTFVYSKCTCQVYTSKYTR